MGEIDPGTVVCNNSDNACDGIDPADCQCMIGQTRGCYDGPAGTAGVGTCHAGNQSCQPATCQPSTNGTMCTQWGACGGEVLPAAPQCDGMDHACTGVLPNCNPMVTCPAPVMTQAGLAVSLMGTASAVSPATIAGFTWAVSDSPAGSTYNFSSTSANPTMFTANNAGVYTVEFTATDSMGRQASCSVLVTATASSYLGTEFWAVTTSNAQLRVRNDVRLCGRNWQSECLARDCRGLRWCARSAARTFMIPANSTVTQNLPVGSGTLRKNSGNVCNTGGCCDAQCCGGESHTLPQSALVTNGAYHIRTSAPVSAYQFNALEYHSTVLCATGTNSYTNDASLLLPTAALTGNYIVLTHEAWYASSDFIAITGTYPTPTQVTVTLPASTGTIAGAYAGATVAAAARQQYHRVHAQSGRRSATPVTVSRIARNM